MCARVLIADDHEVIRLGLRLVLADCEDIHLVGEAADGEAAVSLALEHRPDVLVMDVDMPNMNGLDATRRVRDAVPETRVLILTAETRDQIEEEARDAGADGFLGKWDCAEHLRAAILAVFEGQPYFTRLLQVQ